MNIREGFLTVIIVSVAPAMPPASSRVVTSGEVPFCVLCFFSILVHLVEMACQGSL